MVSQGTKAHPLVRIVAIDDDVEFLDFLTRALSEGGMEIVTSANPEEGLRLALGVRTDIVLLDLKMPTCSGFELLDKIVRANPTINVILLTGEYSTGSAVEAIQKGAADYLNKPISVDALRQRVSKFVATARERHEASQLSHDLRPPRSQCDAPDEEDLTDGDQ
jgi:DNA-binding NtrC family response regulator